MSEIDVREIGLTETAPATTYERPTTRTSWELVWIVAGTSQLTSGDDTYPLLPNTVVLTPPGVPYLYSWDPERVCREGYVVFTTDAATGHDWPLLRHLTEDDVILALLNHLLWLEATRPAGWQDQAREALGYALRTFGTGASGTSSLSDRELPEPIERSMALVRARWSPGSPLRTPSLAELADAASVTPEHLCRVYKKELGYGPIAALRLLRLRHTAALLARTNLTVGEVAHQGGFDNQFHFSRAFKQVLGLTPTECRRTYPPPVSLPNAIRRLGLYL